MSNKKSEDLILEELKDIKKLIILALYGLGYPSEEIDKAVGLGAANIRGMFSKKNIMKGLKAKNEENKK